MQYEILVAESVFDCQFELDKEVIFTMNHHAKRLEDPLFKFQRPTTDLTFQSHFDERRQYFEIDRGIEFNRHTVCSAFANLDELTQNELEDPDLMLYECRRKMLWWQFHNNEYKNCNQASQGAIFHLENQAQVNVSGSSTRAENNSALRGGFAFLKDEGTLMLMKAENVSLETQRAYFGGAFFIDQKAHLELENAQISKGEVYEGMFYLDNQSILNASNVKISENLAHHRAMISAHQYSFFTVTKSTFFGNEAKFEAVILFIDTAEDLRYYISQSADEFKVIVTRRSELKEVLIQSNRMEQGGSLMKIIGSNLLVKDTRVLANDLFYKYGGINLYFADLEVQNSEFEMFDNETVVSILSSLSFTSIKNMQGGFINVGANSSLLSVGNTYRNARADTGGCISIVGLGSASFTGDRFIRCAANIGGAIYGSDFESLSAEHCYFDENIVYLGKGAHIFAQRYHGLVSLRHSSFFSFSNAVYLEQGNDLETDHLVLRRAENLIKPGRILYTYTLEMNNKTESDDLDDASNQLKNLSENFDYSVKEATQTFQKYAGGFHLKNMKKISSFKNVRMAALQAEYGGCIHVELDQNFREQATIFNKEAYHFANLELWRCLSWLDGGAIQIRNVRRMEIVSEEDQPGDPSSSPSPKVVEAGDSAVAPTNGTNDTSVVPQAVAANNTSAPKEVFRTSITEAYAFRSGGGINFVCDALDVDSCELRLGRMHVTDNAAKENGGGIYW